MVTIFKDVSVPGIEVIPCRLNGPRGIVKAFLLHDEQGLIAVDTGFSDEDAGIILERIKAIGRRPDELTTCVLTHPHKDHTGGLKKLRSAADFIVLSHALDAAEVESVSGVKVDRFISDGEQLPGMGGIQVIHMPGHTPGSVALYLPRARAILAGDAIFSAGEWLIASPPYLCAEPEQARESVRRLLAMNLPIDVVLVCHGDDVYRDAQSQLQQILVERRQF